MMFKRAKVVMLPTNEKALNLTPIVMFNNKLFTCYSGNYSYDKAIFQHLYILSDEEIKEGDWFLSLDFDIIGQLEKGEKVTTEDVKKIIATTDKYLYSMKPVFTMGENKLIEDYIPQLSQSFIEKYIEEYNKGRVIDKVMVEYEEKYPFEHELGKKRELLKINPKDNTITIRKVKDSWTREEITILLSKHFVDAGSKIGLGSNVTDFTKQWVKENL